MKVKVKLKAKGLNFEFNENDQKEINPNNYESIIIESYQMEDRITTKFKPSHS